MTDISFKNLSNKTTIEVSPTFLDKIAKEALPKINDSFVPPLFSEYCISIIEKNGNFNYFKTNLILKDKTFNSLPQEIQDKLVTETLKENNCSVDEISVIYVKYTSATEWTIIFFDGCFHKKIFTVDCEYGVDNKQGYFSTIRQFSNKYSKSEMQAIVEKYIFWMLCVSWYMQNINNFIEYDFIQVDKLSPKKRKNDIVSDSKQTNNNYVQKIKIKSKKKKYILSEQTVKSKKTYNRVKTCWYVRGYYQRFGKDKILKYIPPRINYRDKEKIEDNRKLPFYKQTYQLIDDKS